MAKFTFRKPDSKSAAKSFAAKVGFDWASLVTLFLNMFKDCGEDDPAESQNIARQVLNGKGNPLRNAKVRAMVKRNSPRDKRKKSDVDATLREYVLVDAESLATAFAEAADADLSEV